MLLLRNKAQQ